MSLWRVECKQAKGELRAPEAGARKTNADKEVENGRRSTAPVEVRQDAVEWRVEIPPGRFVGNFLEFGRGCRAPLTL